MSDSPVQSACLWREGRSQYPSETATSRHQLTISPGQRRHGTCTGHSKPRGRRSGLSYRPCRIRRIGLDPHGGLLPCLALLHGWTSGQRSLGSLATVQAASAQPNTSAVVAQQASLSNWSKSGTCGGILCSFSSVSRHSNRLPWTSTRDPSRRASPARTFSWTRAQHSSAGLQSTSQYVAGQGWRGASSRRTF